MTSTLLEGDCLAILPTLDENSIDSCVTDPPYHLQSINKRFAKVGRNDKTWSKSGPHQRTARGFMNKEWDGGDIAFRPETWAEVLRVLKPGAHLIAFGGTRTFARMSVAIEDAGFEIRDTICWLYGTGFPKSHNAGNGWGTALKPAFEPVILARKPLSEKTVAANIRRWGAGAINIDGCRIETESRPARSNEASASGLTGNGGALTYGKFAVRGSVATGTTDLGRWPANIITDGSNEVVEAFPDSQGQNGVVDGQISERSVYQPNNKPKPRHEPRTDSGSAARFFYSAKADADDRWGSKHPTVKPVDLIRYLAKLITPPKGMILDPFAGSGTLAVAALAEGFDATLIEREAEYCADIRERIAFYSGEGRHSMASKNRAKKAPAADPDKPQLF